MSIRRMTLGAGYRYLMSSVARGDQAGPTTSPLSAYYTAVGTPPGRFLGAGLTGLDGGRGVAAGSAVTEEHLWRMLGMLQDPVTGQALGRAPGAERTACVGASKRTRKPCKTVAGFDLTFSAPKSVSVAWALGDDATRRSIHAAHVRALELVIAYAEDRVLATRTGRGGVVSEDVRGVVAAAFDHWDSRAGDPQLHTHVVVLNRVQSASDGAWRTLDSRALFRTAVGLSELYNGVLADLVTQGLGYRWTPEQRRRSPVEKWEVTGVGKKLRVEFSQRTTEIDAAKDVLVERFVGSHGRQPTSREVLQLRQQATLETRPEKYVRPLAGMIQDWRGRAKPFLDQEPVAWVATLAGRNDVPLLQAGDLSDGMLQDLASQSVAAVSGKRSTFTRANVFAEVLRQIQGVRFADAADRVTVAERVADLGMAAAVCLTPPDLGVVPDELRRPGGSSRFRPRDSELFTTRELLEAEERLLAAARATDAPTVEQETAANQSAATLPGRDHPLSADQADAVCRIVASGRVLDVLVGPAGTGKSTAMAGLRAVWEAQHGPGSVVGLAPSAAAAQVLAESVGVPTENTAKWLVEAAKQPARRAELAELKALLDRASPSVGTRSRLSRARHVAAEIDRWTLRPGQLVIVDEASMAGTFELDALALQTRAAGAKLLLVGDWAQLSPVAAGGAFKLVATDRDDAPELHDVRRFRNEWERSASLRLRTGDARAITDYQQHERVQGGQRELMLDALFADWCDDVRAGKTSLMVAADAQTVSDLNARARAARVASGDVREEGITVSSGHTIGAGDRVVTRLNQRHLPGAGSWVKNGDEWVVQGVHPDGSVTVRRPNGSASETLPPPYVRDHLELGYATTAHRAQGRTVDTARAFVTGKTLREPLYVMATRGREGNWLYVDTMHDPDVSTAHVAASEDTPEDILRQVLDRTGSDRSATEMAAGEARPRNPARMEAEGAAVLNVRRGASIAVRSQPRL